MHSGSKVKKNILSGGAKALVSVVVLTLIFSPFSQVSTPVVRADVPTASTEASYGPAYTAPNTKTNTGSTSDICASFTSCILLPVYALTAGLGSVVAYVGSYIFSVAAQLSLNSAAYGLQFVTNGWTTARDIANMGFILILIYIAVSIILSAETAHTMGTLALVIFIALIINFSFFFTRLVIDAGNIVAVEFYNASLSKDSTTGTTVMIPGTQTPDMTAGIMGGLGVQKILGGTSFSQFEKTSDVVTQFITLLIVYLFMGAIYFMLAAAFVSVGIKFIVRIAVLWLMIIASPLALIAKASHRFEKYYDQWQATLIAHAFYPAVFLFIFWLITQFAGSLNITDIFSKVSAAPGASITDALIQIGGTVADICIRLGFIIVMLFLGMKAADGMGVIGGKAANSIGNKLAFGSVGFAGRQTFGRMGYAASRSEGLRDWAATSTIGRTLWRGANTLGRGTFDLRGLPGAGQLKDQLGTPGGKGGVKATIEARAKKVESEAKELKDTDAEKAKRGTQVDADFERNRGVSFADAQANAAVRETNATETQQTTARALENFEGEIKAKSEKERDEQRKEIREELRTRQQARDDAQSALTVAKKTVQELKRGRETAISIGDKARVEKYASSMDSRRLWNLGLPSVGSRLGAEKARKLVRDKKPQDRLMEAAQQLVQENQPPASGAAGAAPDH